jgi:hypothetical protein
MTKLNHRFADDPTVDAPCEFRVDVSFMDAPLRDIRIIFLKFYEVKL